MSMVMLPAFAPEFVLVAALLAGLATSYGRELHEGRRPGGRWWLSNLLLLPTVGITSKAADDLYPLSSSLSAFLTVMLVLTGYQGLRSLQKRWCAQILDRTGER